MVDPILNCKQSIRQIAVVMQTTTLFGATTVFNGDAQVNYLKAEEDNIFLKYLNDSSLCEQYALLKKIVDNFSRVTSCQIYQVLVAVTNYERKYMMLKHDGFTFFKYLHTRDHL